MKRFFILFFSYFCITTVFSENNSNELEYTYDNNSIIINNFDNGKPVCTGHVEITNKTNEEVDFTIFGETSGVKKMLRKKDSISKNSDKESFFINIKKYDKIILTFSTAVELEKAVCESKNMCIYIKYIKSVQSPDFDFSFERQLTNTDYAFANAKIWIAETFVSAKTAIQIEDKESGTIVGKAQNSDGIKFTFKIKIRNSKASIEFYDYENYKSDSVENKQKSFDFLSKEASTLAAKFFITLETE